MKIQFLLISSLFFAPDVYSLELSQKEFLEKIKAQNIEIKVERAKVGEARARSIGVDLPPPMLGFIQFQEEGGKTANGFEVNQGLPFPTKLTKAAAARKYLAKAQVEESIGRESEILAQARLLYFSLWAISQKVELLKEKREALAGHINLTRSTARSDSFVSIHLVKAESDLDFLETDILVAEQNLQVLQAQAAVMLNEDPGQFQLQEPPLREIKKIEKIEQSPQLRAAQFNVESLKAKETEADSAWLPDFTLRYREMDSTSMAPKSKEVMLSLTLPFAFPWEPYSASTAAGQARQQADYNLLKQKRELQANWQNLQSRAELLKKQIDVLKTKILPRAQKRVHLIHNLAPRDMESLEDHRQALEALPELKMKLLDARMQYEETLSAIEKYLPQNEVN